MVTRKLELDLERLIGLRLALNSRSEYVIEQIRIAKKHEGDVEWWENQLKITNELLEATA